MGTLISGLGASPGGPSPGGAGGHIFHAEVRTPAATPAEDKIPTAATPAENEGPADVGIPTEIPGPAEDAEVPPGEIPAAPTEIQVTVPAEVEVAARTSLLLPAELPGELLAGVTIPATTEDPTWFGDPATEAKVPATPTEAKAPTVPAEVEVPTTPAEDESPLTTTEVPAAAEKSTELSQLVNHQPHSRMQPHTTHRSL